MSGALGDSTNCRNASQWQSVLDRNTNEQRQATTKQNKKAEGKIKFYSKEIIKNPQNAWKGIHVKLFHEILRIRTASGELQL